MCSTNTTITTAYTALVPPSFQDHLQISQTARSAAQREAVPAFWCAVNGAVQHITRLARRVQG